MWYSFNEGVEILIAKIDSNPEFYFYNGIHCKLKIWQSNGLTQKITEGFGTFDGHSFNKCTARGIVKEIFIPSKN